MGSFWGSNMSADHAPYVLENLGNSYAVSEFLSKSLTIYGWTTHDHTGEDAPLWSYGPAIPVGNFDNTELAEMVTYKFGFKLNKITNRLFVDADEALPGAILDETDPENPVLVYNGAKLPIRHNDCYTGDRLIQ